MLVFFRAKEIRARINRQMNLWDRGLHEGLVGDAETEGATTEGRATSGREEEDEAVVRSYHDTVLSGNLRQAVRRVTNREGGGRLLPDDQCTNIRQPVAEVIWEKHLNTQVPPVENPTCAAFEDYGEVPETVPLDFTEDDVMWVVSKISGAAGALGAEAIELRNWLFCFGCVSEELRFVVTILADWMVNSSPPWAAYRALISCRLVALDKIPPW